MKGQRDDALIRVAFLTFASRLVQGTVPPDRNTDHRLDRHFGELAPIPPRLLPHLERVRRLGTEMGSVTAHSR